MKLLNKCEKYRDKPVQLTITSIVLSTPMHHYNSLLLLQMVSVTTYGVTIKSCSGAWVWLILHLLLSVVYRVVPVLFNSVPFIIFLKDIY